MTPFPGARRPRISSLIRWPTPLAHDEPGRRLVEPQAPLLGPAGGTTRPPVPPQPKGRALALLQPKEGDPGASTSQLLPPSPSEPEVTEEGPATTPFTLPYGLKNAAATYSSSASTSLSAYADLPSHHLRSTLDLIATPPASTYPRRFPRLKACGPARTSPASVI